LLSNSVSSIRGPSSAPDAATVFPNFLEIDYVRVYQPAPFAPPPTILVKGDMPTADGAAEESAQ
jgi:hypothetical protein